MASEPQRNNRAAAIAARPARTGPFGLRPLLHRVPLSENGDSEDIKINCVDYLDGNLYVGTSASELLHFFRIPPDPSDPNPDDTFILASRLKLETPPGSSRPGVQQILLLPRVNKACILCDWTVSFYSLPELSPVYGTTQVKNCNWIGGADLNEGAGDTGSGMPGVVTVLLSLNRRIRLIKIGDEAPRVLRTMDVPGTTLSVRRDSIACVADSKSYQLLNVDEARRIPLMSISSLDNLPDGSSFGQVQNVAGPPDGGLFRSASSASTRPSFEHQTHSRSTSLGDFISKSIHRRNGESDDPVFQDADTPPPPSRSPAPSGAQQNKPLPPSPPSDGLAPQAAGAVQARTPPARTMSPAATVPVTLKPHIVSPTPEEFLLVTGTSPLDPGIGMFVNLDGDPTRPTLEFERYPREIVVDGGSADLSSSHPSLGEVEGYVLASMSKEFEDGLHEGLEIQRFDLNFGQDEPEKWWLEVEDQTSESPIGIRSMVQSEEMRFEIVVEKLSQRRFSPFSGHSVTPTMSLRSFDSRTALSIERLSQERELFDPTESEDEVLPKDWEATRNKEGEDFVRALAKSSSRLAVWRGSNIWWAVRNPLLLQLEDALENIASQEQLPGLKNNTETRKQLLLLLDTIKGREPKTELEFMTLGYIKQRASIMLLESFLNTPETPFTDVETKAMEDNLLGGDLDARVVLSLIPALRNEIIVSKKGIWIYGGIKAVVEGYIAAKNEAGPVAIQGVASLAPHVLEFLRRFLTAWRRKKGFGSIPDEVFRTVDACLLLVLLELDKDTPFGQSGRSGSVRKELNDLVDNGVDCFDRAVDLLESYRRLFVLSRLYQNRKMAAEVLATWRRIIEGEEDRGGELGNGEQRVRGYLSNLSNQGLVQEYGIWLATRNPKLGVQVFADERGRAPKFEHTQVVALLREEAPDAVAYYLEHLVFDKGNTAYVNELITFYLDMVISDLQKSKESREMVANSYEAYRALESPKPTYIRFLSDNAPPNDDVWQARLRLLQLLSGGHDYDAGAIGGRIDECIPSLLPQQNGDGDRKTPNGFDLTHKMQPLVPEAIILAGRARRHEDALRLLVHRLADYDTSVSYCLRGPAALSPPSARRNSKRRDSESSLPPTWEEQQKLFGFLLKEFLALEDTEERIEQTGALLERFGAWFDVLEVLSLIPDDWEVEIVAEFLVSALRRLVVESRETVVARSLSGAENLRVGYEYVVKVEEKGGMVESGGGGWNGEEEGQEMM
ncbi:hypothetical protein QBC38DRAFT_404084 [Podospora fimiseda]|uniref:CNH domain-containing protein n=1 Tax=Podospora fimiseda TaxID=252190 RepID=A0AAN7BF13_9PEZI|nr:hypothetical protein QBC38DRAFT_404084 [Podospora fimiseda]